MGQPSTGRSEHPGHRTTVRFRHHPALVVAGLIVTISMFALVAVWPWSAVLLAVPVAWTVWVWRAGTDADRDGLRVRALLGQRRIRWSEVAALSADPRGRVHAVLTGGGQVPLTAVTSDDLPRVTAVAPHS